MLFKVSPGLDARRLLIRSEVKYNTCTLYPPIRFQQRPCLYDLLLGESPNTYGQSHELFYAMVVDTTKSLTSYMTLVIGERSRLSRLSTGMPGDEMQLIVFTGNDK